MAIDGIYPLNSSAKTDDKIPAVSFSWQPVYSYLSGWGRCMKSNLRTSRFIKFVNQITLVETYGLVW